MDVSVSLQGDRRAIGAPNAAFSGVVATGEVRLCHRQPNDTWTLERTMRAPGATSQQAFGLAMGITAARMAAATQDGATGTVCEFGL